MIQNYRLNGPWVDYSEALAWIVTGDAACASSLGGRPIIAVQHRLGEWLARLHGAYRVPREVDYIPQAQAKLINALRQGRVAAFGAFGGREGDFSPALPIQAHDWSRLWFHPTFGGVYTLDNSWAPALRDVRISAADLMERFPSPSMRVADALLAVSPSEPCSLELSGPPKPKQTRKTKPTEASERIIMERFKGNLPPAGIRERDFIAKVRTHLVEGQQPSGRTVFRTFQRMQRVGQ